MVQKHWTPQRIILVALVILFVGYKLLTEDDIPQELAIGALIVGIVGTIIFFAVRKKGVFAKK